MRRISKILLTAEVVVCFAPIAFGILWMCMLMATPFLMMLHGKAYDGWSEWIRGLIPFLAALMGCAALLGLLSFILEGQRIMSKAKLATGCLVGLSALVIGAVEHRPWGIQEFAYCVAPFLCAVHVLYLGRSYFTRANKTMEPTR